MATLFEAAQPTLALTSEGSYFPVRRVFCIGQNYAAHAREMGSDPATETPFFFTKWAEAIILSGGTIAYPSMTENYHYEGELVVAVGRAGRDIAADDALGHVYGYAAGLDMTRRDLQAEAKRKGRPWDAGKNVEQSAPVGLIHPAAQCGDISSASIRLTQNGEVRQESDLSDLIWRVPQVIALISRYYRLEPGDLIFTGTPSGVGPVVPGDTLVVTIEGLTPLEITIGSPVG